MMKKESKQNTEKSTPMTVQEIDTILETIRKEPVEEGVYYKPHPSFRLTIKEISLQVQEATKQMEGIFKHVSVGEAIPIEDIEKVIIPVIARATEIPHIYHLFYELTTKDEYTYRHTISVGIISTLIGKWLNLPQKELVNLSLAATLHDIGKAKVPIDILNKPGKLTKSEYEEMMKHTVYGYELLKSIDSLDESVALVALQHHEREDGNGYPIGLMGDQIHQFSKIVAIADVFHAMSSTRVYQEASPFYKVMKQMQREAFGKLDPHILLLFLNKMMSSIVGKKVILTDGRTADIIMIHPYDPIRCLVKTAEGHIDLRYHTRIQIDRIIED